MLSGQSVNRQLSDSPIRGVFGRIGTTFKKILSSFWH